MRACTLLVALATLSASARAVVIRPMDPPAAPACRPVWKCAPFDLDEFDLDEKRSNILGAVLICAYPTRDLDEQVSPYCTYSLNTGKLVGEYNAIFCPSYAVRTPC